VAFFVNKTMIIARDRVDLPKLWLQLESLEDRMMLSTVQIFAAGATGEEQVQLEVDGQVVRTFNNIQGDYESGQFQTLTYTSADSITASQIRLVFANDGSTTSGEDKNLRVDRIRIDGVNFEAEAANVFSDGHWIDGAGCSEGFLGVETLQCGGYFQFAGGSAIRVSMAGQTGEEQSQLEINGQVVRTWNNIGGDYEGGAFVNRTYIHNEVVQIEDVRLLFSNDGLTPGGEDKNLRLDRVVLDGIAHEAESAFADGHWVDGVGCSSGFLGVETLHCGGYFDFGQPLNATTVVVRAAGTTGEEQARLVVNGQVVKTWNNIAGDFENRDFVQLTYTSDQPISIEDIRIEFSNNGNSAAGFDRDLAIDSVSVDGTVYQAEGSDVFSEGHWVNGVGCSSGFLAAEVLHCGGYFDFSNVNSSGKLRLETNLINVTEDTTNVVIKVIREQGSTGAVTVDYQTEPLSATAGSDYVTKSGTLTFGDGVLERSVTLTILNDNLNESNEAFSFTIDNPVGVVLSAPRTAQINIVDDDAPTTDPLLAHWKFDEDAIGIANDSTANGKDGIHRNFTVGFGPSAETPLLNSPNEKSLQFDGANDYVSVTSANPALSGSQFSQTFWVNPDFVGGETRGVFAGTNAAFPAVSIIGGSKVSFSIGTGGDRVTATTGNVLQEDAWNFVATTYDGSSMRIYVDGVLRRITAATGFGTFGTGAFEIGRAGGNYFKGHVDEFKFFDKRLSAAEISQEFSEQTDVTSELIASASGLVAIDFIPDTDIMLMADFGGLIYVHENGQTLSQPFINISSQVNGVRGMLDIAVHPDFANTPYVYLAFAYDPPEVFNHTGLAGPNGGGNRASRLIRVTADASNNYRTAIAGSEVVLLGTNSTWENFNAFVDSTIDFDEPPGGINADGTNVQDFLAADSQSHTIDAVEFGPDGALYVSNGDGASYNAPDPRAARVLDIDNLSGKVLRIDSITGEGLADNPFYNGNANANRSKVYQYGFRNPFRMTFNDLTGQLYVGDVGWSSHEEINAGSAGANFGWPFFEGSDASGPIRNPGYEDLPEATDYYASPEGQSTQGGLLSLSHSATGIDALILGDVYDGGVYGSEYEGDLFFNYLGSGLVRHISFDSAGNVTSVESFTDNAGFIVQMKVAPDGHVYYVDQTANEVRRWVVN
jgi:glucose/arabinose dehydrogenase